MLQNYSWFFYALAASVSWGVHYATAGQLSKTIPSPLISMVYLVFVAVFSIAAMAAFSYPTIDTEHLLSCWTLSTVLQAGLLVLTGCIGNFLVFSAIADSSATKASIVEITYPFFVALFTLMIYGENELTEQTIIGGVLVIVGITVVVKG